MTIHSPLVGEQLLLSYMLGTASPGNLELRLYTNNYTIVDGTVLGTLVESSASGYAAITLTMANWVISNIAGVITATQPAVTFSYTSAETVRGYFLTTAGRTQLAWGEQFGSSFSFPPAGGNLVITPSIDLTS